MNIENLKLNERLFFEKYLDSLSLSQRHNMTHVHASIAGSPELADSLLDLYLEGKKTAGSSLYLDYISAGDPLPKVDNHWIILDSMQNPRCIVKTIKIEQFLFNEIPISVAISEGEGDLSLTYWREAHINFFTPFLSGLGILDLETALVIVESFEVVFINEALNVINKIKLWAQNQSDILGLLLVGSYAQNKNKPDSDIDFMLLVSNVEHWLQNKEWLNLFGNVEKIQFEDWGIVKTIRVFYKFTKESIEVEFNFSTIVWATVDPIEPNTFRVISDGVSVLHDPQGILTNLIDKVALLK